MYGYPDLLLTIIRLSQISLKQNYHLFSDSETIDVYALTFQNRLENVFYLFV